MENSVGSVWRKWDLHVHTASSYDSKYKGPDANQLLCDALHNNQVHAVAITDHFKIDWQRIGALRQIAPDIVFFPGVELRTDKGADNLHIIIIFSEKVDLQTLSNDFEAIMLRAKAHEKESDFTIYWHFEDIIAFAKQNNGLISIHAGKKTNGIDEEITNAILYKQAIKREIADQIDFFEIGKVQDIAGYQNNVFQTIKEKPLILCSDNHDPRVYSVKENLWIKADLTFEGLKQCIYQPKERVYIGTIPPILDRVNNDPKSNIQWVKVHPNNDKVGTNKKWFDFDLELNPGLIAVIGNKGSGKSALSDIIGHLCRCRTMGNASFLNNTRFCKPPQNYANSYSGEIIWRDETQSLRVLSELPNSSTFEDAQYLPQKYIEDVCNDIESKFQEEIDQVIFSYIEEPERGTATSLSELISTKSDTVIAEIENLNTQMKALNTQIIGLENKQTSEYRKHIADGLKKAQSTLDRHSKSRPKEVQKPKPKENDATYQSRLKAIEQEINELTETIDKTAKEIAQINISIDETRRLIAHLQRLASDVEEVNEQLKQFYSKCPLPDIKYELVALTSPEEHLRNYAYQLNGKKATLYATLEGAGEFSGLKQRLVEKKNDKTALIATADKDEREYQKYLQDVAQWEKEKAQIIGTVTDENSLSFYQHEKVYLDETIAQQYVNLIKQREDLLKKIFERKSSLAQIYKDIYRPVEVQITKLLQNLDESIEFEAEIQLSESNISERLLNFINQRYAGIFRGKSEAHREMDQLIRSSVFSNKEGVLEFVARILSAIGGTEDSTQGSRIDNLAKIITDKPSFYDLLFGLNYIGVSFKLKMGGRSLEQLSPGERGIVLLIFYLALSKNNSPIIIDQPEDNLDNQSVYGKLVPCICAAKQKRQVIIVTHNPNIAVACDAEQIVCCQMDKQSFTITYTSGAIENESIRKRVVDVLEGTMPAFNLRERKYGN